MFDVWAPEKPPAGGTVLRDAHCSVGTVMTVPPHFTERDVHTFVEQLSAEVRSPRLQPEFSSQQTMN